MYALKLFAAVGAFALVCLAVSTTFAQEPTREHAQNASPKPRLEISKETTVIDGPLTEDGYVDYLAALNEHASRGVTPENNAVVLLMQAVGPHVVEEKVRAEFFQKLGVEAPAAEGDYLISLDQFYRQEAEAADKPLDISYEKLNDQQDKARFAPWSAEDYPLLARWIEVNEKPLAIVAEAVERPRYYAPLVSTDADGTVISALLPISQQSREVGRALVARAMLRLEQGELDAAWHDLHTLHRLARLAGQGETLIDALIGISLHAMAVDATATLLHEGEVTPEQLRQVRTDLVAKLPPLPKMSERVDVGERYMFLDAVSMMARKGPGDLAHIDGKTAISQVVSKLIPATAIDWNLIARRGNHWYDRMVQAARGQTYAERAKALTEVEEELEQLVENAKGIDNLAKRLLFAGGNLRQVASEQVNNVLIALFVPSLRAVIGAEERAQTQADLLQVATALAQHRAAHGRYPPTLNELAAEPPLPLDRYTGKPLHYQRTEEGYVLYSVGPNLKDDQGAGFDKMPNHDIVLRQPAKQERDESD